MLIVLLLVLLFPGQIFGQTVGGTNHGDNENDKTNIEIRDEIPSFTLFFESIRLGNLIYSMTSAESAAFKFATTPFTPYSFIDDDNGLQAFIAVSNATSTIYVTFRGTDGEEQDTLAILKLFDCMPFVLPPIDDDTTEISQSTSNAKTGDGSGNTLRGSKFTSSSSTDTLGPFGSVHEGFYSRLFDPKRKIYKQLAHQVRNVAEQYPDDYNIISCGHSLGGSESLMFSVVLALQVFPNRKIRHYSVGMPKTGNQAFKEKLESIDNLSIVRMVYNTDFAPHAPLPGLVHTGHLLLYLDEDYDNSHKEGRSDYSLRLYYRQYGSKEDGYAGVPTKDWLVTPIDFLIPFGNLYPFFSHIPWRYEEAADRANRQGNWPTNFEPYDGRSCCFFAFWC